mmetsp:Transcript_26674/g.79582  ORF Transcript_26674/g.79582 Transcript_26674/m.79582 type:complete len:205 (-) Transcript_26674:11-625(-)
MMKYSWKASLLPACEPPLMTLKHGTGSTSLSLPASLAKYWYRGMPSHSAPALAAAIEMPRIALAPNFDLLRKPSPTVPVSISHILSSIAFWSRQHMPTIAWSSLLMWPTALVQPLPRYRDLSPSRISHASWMPVEAPEGTIARTVMPPAVVRSTSTVGLPRESRTSRPTMELILVKVSGYSFLMRARTLAFTMAVGREGCRGSR